MPDGLSAQFTIGYNPLTNTMSVEYNECANTCLYGNSFQPICECRLACELPTAQPDINREACLQICFEDFNYGQGPAYDACADICESNY